LYHPALDHCAIETPICADPECRQFLFLEQAIDRGLMYPQYSATSRTVNTPVSILEWVRFAIVVALAVPAFVDAVGKQRAKNVRARF
jgi:hypothetical protein